MGAPNTVSVAIGTAVRQAITTAGLTQAQFAERANMNIKTLGRRLSGAIPFTFPEIVAAAEATGVNLADLIEDAERLAEERAA
jgi:transcriptional regulator with XRE-family HTH domain